MKQSNLMMDLPHEASFLFYKESLIDRSRFLVKKIGFSAKNLKSFSRYDVDISHAGCVNTVKWYNNGSFLITGSDDRLVKIWNANKSPQLISLEHEVPTRHRGNIFCADISPIDPNLVITGAADGKILSNYVSQKHSGKSLYSSDEIM
jgi:WD40 repeat protein